MRYNTTHDQNVSVRSIAKRTLLVSAALALLLTVAVAPSAAYDTGDRVAGPTSSTGIPVIHDVLADSGDRVAGPTTGTGIPYDDATPHLSVCGATVDMRALGGDPAGGS